MDTEEQLPYVKRDIVADIQDEKLFMTLGYAQASHSIFKERLRKVI